MPAPGLRDTFADPDDAAAAGVDFAVAAMVDAEQEWSIRSPPDPPIPRRLRKSRSHPGIAVAIGSGLLDNGSA